jgi:uncharacterized DUF497 family protein
VEAEWDPRKAAANRRKHGVDFADAVTALHDELALTVRDEHPDEERFVTISTDALGRVLVVAYTWRGERVRLISARPATRSERKQYTEQEG